MALLIRNHTMSLSLYDLSVPVFTQSLQALDVVLTKGEAHAAAKKIDLGVFLTARLAPDMFTFTRQVQLATDFAKGGAARIAGVDVPKYDDVEASFAELHARIATVTKRKFIDEDDDVSEEVSSHGMKRESEGGGSKSLKQSKKK